LRVGLAVVHSRLRPEHAHILPAETR
jgi:hypothetical protein